MFTVHPGVVDTPLFRTAIAGVAEKDLPKDAVLDKVALPAHFTVWLASAEAEFLRGRYVWVNWDVEEMIARKEEIQANPSLFTIILGGWPFQ